MRVACLAAFVLAFVPASMPASAGVLVVDAAGGGEYTSLIDAVAAAADGDTVLVRPGDYRDIFGNTILITGRSLVIAADGTGPVRTNPVWVQAEAKRVVLRGLSIEAGYFDGTTSLRLIGGDLTVEACTIIGRDGVPSSASSSGGAGIVTSGGRLVLVDCVVQGGRGTDSEPSAFVLPHPGGHGLHVLGATPIAVHGGSISGGAGGDYVEDLFFGILGNGSTGGFGVLASFDASLLLAGCTVTGGHGGSGTLIPGGFGPSTYAGGSAVLLFGFTKVSLLDATLVGGEPGVDGAGTAGTPGEALELGPGNVVVQFPGAYRGVSFGAPAPEGGALELAIDGVAGDLVGLYLAASTAQLPGPQGIFHLAQPLVGPFLLGPVDATGTLAHSFTVPNLGFGPDGAATLHAQAIVKPAVGAALLSGPATLVLVDDSL